MDGESHWSQQEGPGELPGAGTDRVCTAAPAVERLAISCQGCPWGWLLLLLSLGLLVSRPHVGTGVHTLPRLVSVLLVGMAELTLVLATLGGTLLVLGALGLDVECSHHLSQLLAVVKNCYRCVVRFGTRVVLIQATPEFIGQPPGVKVHAVGQHVAPHLLGQLGDKQRIEEDAVLLPGGSKASIASMS